MKEITPPPQWKGFLKQKYVGKVIHSFVRTCTVVRGPLSKGGIDQIIINR